jgi:4'-phosphopantetheinyl transferase
VNIYWVEQSLLNVPVHDEWLAERELLCLARLRVPKRRRDWRLGRWTAKCAVAQLLQLPHDSASFEGIEILADSLGAPVVYLSREPAAVSISLSHRDGVSACVITQAMIPLGCDLELIEARSDSFVADYFTEGEQTIVAERHGDQRDQLVTTLWSAKESVLKALRVGLRVDTRDVDICLHDQSPVSLFCLPGRWHSFQAHCQNGQALHGWWSSSANLIRTFATMEVEPLH